MCQPPAEGAVRDMLGPAVSPENSIENIRAVPSLRPQRIFEVVLSDGRTLHLVLPSLTMWRPLRSEQDTVSSEAAVVRWIRDAVSHQEERATSTTMQPHDPRQRHQKDQPSSSSISATPNSDLDLPPLPLLLPTLLHHDQKSHLPESSFAVYVPVPGTPLALLPSTPWRSAQRAVDHQLGALFRTLASLTSPTGRFGPLAAVVANNNTKYSSSTHSTSRKRNRRQRKGSRSRIRTTATPPPAATSPPSASASASASAAAAAALPKVLVEGGLSATGGAGTWSVAFHSMLEGVLRDGEDMAVVMAYSAMRRQLRRLGHVLDDVRVGRLVPVDFMLDGVGKEMQKMADTQAEEEDGEETPPTHTNPLHPRHRLRVTGLRDWSSCVFGDPLLAAVFSDPQQQQPPSTAFLEGFNGETKQPEPAHRHDTPVVDPHNLPFLPCLNEAVIEAADTAWIRILLYQVYHAAARIVGEFYRPRQDSSARELEARRKLNEALARLAEVEVPDDAKRKHQRPAGEMSPAKRLRGGEERWWFDKGIK
ncbi:hypothetical protein N658DRAFT_560034 [Parathielavia hyrcaniae]|uniref:Uncharacterized protein n=1 Tax=Parathielavia hyrcaniae TaxID=113614 RepID=A0AAN6T0M6_9PEZI|nr:hypothetical protein N658DRAFT_560034 [Parathielavia hyrcaniae]